MTRRSGVRQADWRRTWLWVAMLCGVFPPLARPAHAQDERSQVVAAALPVLRSGLPAGPAALDPELLCTPRLVGWRCPESLRSAAAASGLLLNGRAFTLICAPGATRCRLLNVRSFIELQTVQAQSRAGTAEVTATVWESGSGGVAHSRRVRVALRRQGSRWVVSD